MGDKLICITKNRKAMKIIILHDADARIEYLDVADHLLGSRHRGVPHQTGLLSEQHHMACHIGRPYPSGLPQV